MPMIDVMTTAGVFDDAARRTLQETLAATLLKWEGAPDTAFFRAQAWCRINEVAGDHFGALGDDAPRFRIDVTVPAGALSRRRKEGLVGEVTQKVCAAAGVPEAEALRVWVLIHEQPEGTWGAGGAIVESDALKALARQERSSAS